MPKDIAHRVARFEKEQIYRIDIYGFRGYKFDPNITIFTRKNGPALRGFVGNWFAKNNDIADKLFGYYHINAMQTKYLKSHGIDIDLVKYKM